MRVVNTRIYLFPFSPISTNRMYGVRPSRGGGGQKFLEPWAQDFKHEVAVLMERQDELAGERLHRSHKRCYTLRIMFLYDEKHFAEAQDASNSVKLLEDAIFEYLGINDRQVTLLVAAKSKVPAGLPVAVRSYTDMQVPQLPGNIAVTVELDGNKVQTLGADDLRALQPLFELPPHAYGDPVYEDVIDAELMPDAEHVRRELTCWAECSAQRGRRDRRTFENLCHPARLNLLRRMWPDKDVVKLYSRAEAFAFKSWRAQFGYQVNDDRCTSLEHIREWLNSSARFARYLLRQEATAERMRQLDILSRVIDRAKLGEGRALVTGYSAGQFEALLLAKGLSVHSATKNLVCRQMIAHRGLPLKPDTDRHSYDILVVVGADLEPMTVSGVEQLASRMNRKVVVFLVGHWSRGRVVNKVPRYPWVRERTGSRKITDDVLRNHLAALGLVKYGSYRLSRKAPIIVLRHAGKR